MQLQIRLLQYPQPFFDHLNRAHLFLRLWFVVRQAAEVVECGIICLGYPDKLLDRETPAAIPVATHIGLHDPYLFTPFLVRQAGGILQFKYSVIPDWDRRGHCMNFHLVTSLFSDIEINICF